MASADTKSEVEKSYTKKELKAFIADMTDRVETSNKAHLHSIIAINEVLRAPGVDSVLDAGMKSQLRDLWTKLGSAGIQLLDPPLLFGLPEGFGDEEELAAESEDVPELLDGEVIEPPKPRKKEIEEPPRDVPPAKDKLN